MFILGQLFATLALLISMIFNVVYFLLVIRIVLSWFAVDSYNEIIDIIYKITEPMLAPFRRLRLHAGMVDLSPIVAFIVLAFLRNFIVGILTQLAYRFG
jgi:YggT family protein